jgi:hypothetical protein
MLHADFRSGRSPTIRACARGRASLRGYPRLIQRNPGPSRVSRFLIIKYKTEIADFIHRLELYPEDDTDQGGTVTHSDGMIGNIRSTPAECATMRLWCAVSSRGLDTSAPMQAHLHLNILPPPLLVPVHSLGIDHCADSELPSPCK